MSTTKILLTFATELEAAASIELLNLRRQQGDLYRGQRVDLLITGMGPMNAGIQTARYCNGYAELWNLGIAGSLGSGSKLGEVSRISSISRWLALPCELDAHSRKLALCHYPKIQSNTEGCHLLTSDYPIHRQTPQIKALSCDLVDMEAYAICHAADACGTPWKCWKLVSDFANDQGPDLIQQNLKRWSKDLAIHLSRELKTIGEPLASKHASMAPH